MSVTALSTVARGRAYENACRNFLKHFLRMDTERVGGANDNGVDLQGHWRLGGRNIYVIVQCKHTSKRLGPRIIRELEGTHSYYSRNESHTSLAILMSNAGFSAQSVLRAMSSRSPILLCHAVGALEHYDEIAASRPAATIQGIECKGILPNPAFEGYTSKMFQVSWAQSRTGATPVFTIQQEA